ncbi:MAG TPA: hypothetical protein DEQ87_15285 [Algoriphagus sp.]|jgi:hypothetical protein|uniref:DUF5687 family protein n=1 Tax=unclassified Algoriphagus TaxID=2641541 RepID=UPI000C3BB267|nr:MULTISPECIES: DUF5687 family protein [unclassified Algoriphagus]MAL14278.1 hypothetical protein [Algoriphagus sp.]MAN88058.1 hypothetical protein [Algoriphagus sp.]QYH37396.1 hypothetical protein GYM62_00680 [Algoriphagus sp. NBT04N3]HAD51373.1 hypothetical protein [Algoriphagus sp.]HAS60186.1 hypothetical protein [Algoriphagus sp.]
MFFELIRLQFLKSVRSTSFAKSVLTNIFLGFIVLLLLLYVLGAGLLLKVIIEKLAEGQDPLTVLNSYLIYFFLGEFMYRYFIQQLPVVELESLLHLPIGKSKIMHILLLRSFISPINVIALLLFLPFGVQVILPASDAVGLIGWIGSIVLTSWILHWFMLWFKQRFEDSTIGLLIVVAVLFLGSGSSYMGWFNLGEIMKPVFDLSISTPIPVIVLAILFVASYWLCFKYHFNNAYLEDLSSEENVRFTDQSIGFFSRFGLAGEMANLEWKLIIRHKKSRTYLMLSGFFLLYGLIFYTNPVYASDEGISTIFIFVGVFITGIFMIQYGQLFLSWNSGNFDFFLNRRGGVEELIRGKYLLFISVSVVCFLASVPYVYFGWQILAVHFATFLFNVGILVHAIIYLALWKPKPMDLNKGAMFNYEGVGAAQWLMVIPMMVLPYLIYLPFSFLVSDYAGLIALSVCGILGIIFFKPLAKLNVQRVMQNKYEISSSFRQEL